MMPQSEADWFLKPPIWSKDLPINISVKSVPNPKLNDVINRSEKFPIKFPIDQVRCKALISTVGPEILQRNIDSVYPLIHEKVLNLCARFLLYKQKNGTDIERKIYKKMSLIAFLERLITKKAVTFVGHLDYYTLLDGTTGLSNGSWEEIGTAEEESPLVMKNYISYDEVKLSALISISSYSYFINNGSRRAQGDIQQRNEIQQEGVIVSIIGPRLVRRHVQEYQDIVIGPTLRGLDHCNDQINQGTAPTVRKIFSDFYEEPILSYQYAFQMYKEKNARITIVHHNEQLFDNIVYAKRLVVSFDTLLIEANYRGKERDKKVYLHLVGIGLGVWSISKHQEKIFVETFAERLRLLGPKLTNISDIDLSYFPRTSSCGGVENGELFLIPGHPTGIRIHISQRQTFSRLSDPDKLLVASYAADGNSLPGNEFWGGALGNSSDSATASACQVAELHNPHINPAVTAANLRVATTAGTVIPISEYLKYVTATI